MKTLLRVSLLLLLGLGFTITAMADVAATIAKVRAHLGGEAALNGVNSVRFTGKLTLTGVPNSEAPADIEIIFQRPNHQRILASSPARIETTALDDYEAWQRVADPANPADWSLTLLPVDQVKRLRANTWESLNFFKNIEAKGGSARDEGYTQIDGRRAHKITFVHDRAIAFTRYFDVLTGKLLLTEAEGGGTIREEGEIIVNGVTFPRRVITTNRLPDGSERSVIVTFDKVEVNLTFPASTFAMPALGSGT